MINKVVILLVTIVTAAALITFAGKYLLEPATKSVQDQIESIEKNINLLKQEIKQYRLKAFNAEMEAQSARLVEWEEYVKKIEEVEKYDNEIHKTEKQIEELTNKKRTLMESQKENPQNAPSEKRP